MKRLVTKSIAFYILVFFETFPMATAKIVRKYVGTEQITGTPYHFFQAYARCEVVERCVTRTQNLEPFHYACLRSKVYLCRFMCFLHPNLVPEKLLRYSWASKLLFRSDSFQPLSTPPPLILYLVRAEDRYRSCLLQAWAWTHQGEWVPHRVAGAGYPPSEDIRARPPPRA